MQNTHLLEMKGISKSFASNIVLRDISLHLDKGEVIALLGENGAGKSTLMKILGGIYRADAGEIVIEGDKKEIHNVASAGENGIRIIHQEIFLVPHRTIAENIFLGREYKNKLGFVDKRRMEKEAQALIDEYSLNLRANTLVRELPIGMQQLVEILKAVSADARIVVMDEPTSSLSQSETDTLFKIIGILKSKNVGIIYISHRLEELFQITDRILVMRDGILVGNKTTSQTDKDTLIGLMVGRELTSYYTRTKHPISDTALEVKNLSHAEFFSNISFYARYGEIVGFAGLVGAGRTELMKTIFATYPKAGGEVHIDGTPVKIKTPRDAIDAGIAYIPEDRREEGLVLVNDIAFNMGLVNLRQLVKGVRVHKNKWLTMVENYRQKFSIKFVSNKQQAGLLSGGNQQKLVLSKWLASGPKIIILDEPTRGIDVGSKSEIYAIIDELASAGACIIMVSSELPEIINMCNRCYVMCEGRLTGELQQDEFSQEEIMRCATSH